MQKPLLHIPNQAVLPLLSSLRIQNVGLVGRVPWDSCGGRRHLSSHCPLTFTHVPSLPSIHTKQISDIYDDDDDDVCFTFETGALSVA